MYTKREEERHQNILFWQAIDTKIFFSHVAPSHPFRNDSVSLFPCNFNTDITIKNILPPPVISVLGTLSSPLPNPKNNFAKPLSPPFQPVPPLSNSSLTYAPQTIIYTHYSTLICWFSFNTSFARRIPRIPVFFDFFGCSSGNPPSN